MDGAKGSLRQKNYQEDKKVQFTFEQSQQNSARSGLSSFEQGFQDYNSEHLLQFKSGRPMQSFSDLQSLTIEPQARGLEDDDEDIELDDNGESVAAKKQMLRQFYTFDCFLLRNQQKIENDGNIPNQASSLLNRGTDTTPTSSQEIDLNNNNQKSIDPHLQHQRIPAFHTLKHMKIDFDKVSSHFPSDRLEEVLKQNQQDTSNNKPAMYDLPHNSTITDPSQISHNNNNNNSQASQLLQLSSLKKPTKDKDNFLNFTNYVNSYTNNGNNNISHIDNSIAQNTSNLAPLMNKKQTNNKNNSKVNQILPRQKKRAITLAYTDNVQELMGIDSKIFENKDNKKRTVQDVILKLSIRSSLMVYKFIRALKKRVNFNSVQELTTSQLELVNDLSHFDYSDKSQRQKKRYSNCVYYLISMKFQYIAKCMNQYSQSCLSCIADSEPIDPTTNKMVFWLILQFLFIVVALFYTPLEIINGSTYDEKYGKTWIYFKFCNMLVFFSDILLKFNTGLFERGQIVMNRREIVKAYFDGSFLFDVLALIPVTQTLLQIDYLRPINVLILLKVITATRILSQLQELISQRNSQLQNTISLLQLLLMICSVCHIFACLFIGIAVVEDKYELTKTNWMIKNNIFDDNIHWFSKYIASLYFAVTTMITVGYGDIYPVTTYEIFFVTIAMFVSCGVFAYSFNQIGDLVREQNRMSNEFKREMVLVNRLLEKKKINRDLQIQVRKFLEFRFYAEPQLSMEEEQAVMSKLSHHLREKVILESNFQIINQCTLLRSNFSQKFLETLALKMTEIRVSKNEIIFEKDDEEENPLLYIINKGYIEIFVETDKGDNEITLIQTLDQGKYFGELNFFNNGPRDACARAGDFTILYGIPKTTFLETVEDFPLDFEQFCFMKDNIIYGNKYNTLNLTCNVCKREDHLGVGCSKIHYIPDKESILLKDNFSMKQQRVRSMPEIDESGFHKKMKTKTLSLMGDVNYMQKFFMNQDENFIFIAANYPEFMETCDMTIIDDGTVDQFQNTSNTNNQLVSTSGGMMLGLQRQVPSQQQISGTDMKKFLATSREQLEGYATHTSQIYGQKITEQSKIESDIESPKNQGRQLSTLYSPNSKRRQSQLQIATNNTIPSNQGNSSSKQRQGTNLFALPVLQNMPSLQTGSQGNVFQIGVNNGFGNMSSPKGQGGGGMNPMIGTQNNNNNMFGISNMLNSKKKNTIVRRFANNLHTHQYIHSQNQLQYPQPGQNPMYSQNSQNCNEDDGTNANNYPTNYQFSNVMPHSPNGNSNQNQQYQQQQQIQMLIQLLMKQQNGFQGNNNGLYGFNNHSGTQNNISILHHTQRGTPSSNQGQRNQSIVRRATRMTSTNNKKKEKEQLLAQVQDGFREQFLNEGSQDIDLSIFFEKMKNYTIFFPKQNASNIIKSLETFYEDQPAYFGVYSFTIRPKKPEQRQLLQQKQAQIAKEDQQQLNNTIVNSPFSLALGASPSINSKNSRVMNGSIMGTSTLTLNPNGNAAFFKHKGSMLPGILSKGSSYLGDNLKKSMLPGQQQRHSIFSNINQKGSGSFRGESLLNGLSNQNSSEFTKQGLIKNGLLQQQGMNYGNNNVNQDYSVMSLAQQQPIELNRYPNFIFKKLITLS